MNELKITDRNSRRRRSISNLESKPLKGRIDFSIHSPFIRRQFSHSKQAKVEASFRDKYLLNSQEMQLITAEEVKAEPMTTVNNYEMPELVSAERVRDEHGRHESNGDPKKDIMLDGGEMNDTNVATINHTNEGTKEQDNIRGKSEIIIDSIKPTDPKSVDGGYKGRPIGMMFLYQADKLSCVVKCHDKGHLQEAQRRVSLK